VFENLVMDLGMEKRLEIKFCFKAGKSATVTLQMVNAAYGYVYTGCHRRNGPNFGRAFLMLNYTDITQNTYVQS